MPIVSIDWVLFFFEVLWKRQGSRSSAKHRALLRIVRALLRTIRALLQMYAPGPRERCRIPCLFHSTSKGFRYLPKKKSWFQKGKQQIQKKTGKQQIASLVDVCQNRNMNEIDVFGNMWETSKQQQQDKTFHSIPHHNATYYKILQHTTTYHNMLQHAATCHIIPQPTTIHLNTPQHNAA